MATAEAERVKIAATAEAERMRIAASAEAEQTRELGDAEAAAVAARMGVYATQDPRILLALAAQSLAGSLPSIGTLNLTPDVLTAVLAKLSSGAEA
jgi:regulator of protease activity HflC (stomatin/prohibitin superfamily)